MTQLRLFDGLELHGDPSALSGRAGQKKRLALLALLGAVQPKRLSRDKIVGLLWPDLDPAAARHQLASASYDLKRGLGEASLQTVGDEIGLSPELVQTDVAEFENALTTGDYRRAVDLYTGPFLDGFVLSGARDFEEWVERERVRLFERFAQAVEFLAADYEEAGELSRAVDLWKRVASHDRCNGRVAQRLMRALAAVGDRAAAVRHAEIHTMLVQSELGMDPDPLVAALAEELKREPAGVSSPAPLSRDTISLLAPRPMSAPATRPGRRLVQGGLAAGVMILLAAGFVARNATRFSTAAPEIQTVAVLPLESLSSDPEQQFFADGMTDALITELARVDRLRVTSRSSAMRYRGSRRPVREIAAELGVDAVIEGTVLRDGSRLRVTAQLVAAATDQNLWADSYERDARDVLALQSEVSRAIARGIFGNAAVARSHPAEMLRIDPLVYARYLRGLAAWNGGDLRGALQAFQKVSEQEPTFAPVFAHLGLVYAARAQGDRTKSDTLLNAGYAAAKRAVQLDPGLAEGHAAIGTLRMLEYDWDAASRALARAIELNPSHVEARLALSNYFQYMGRVEEAVAEALTAQQLDPLSLRTRAQLGRALYAAHRFDDARAQFRSTLALNPEARSLEIWIACSYLRQHRYREGVDHMLQAVRAFPPELFRGHVAYAYAAAGQKQAALNLLRRIEAERPPRQEAYIMAIAYGYLGDLDRAFDWMNRSVDRREDHTLMLKVEPAFDPIRADPRFDRLLKRIHLVPSDVGSSRTGRAPDHDLAPRIMVGSVSFRWPADRVSPRIRGRERQAFEIPAK